jgi:hypothetical protein
MLLQLAQLGGQIIHPFTQRGIHLRLVYGLL